MFKLNQVMNESGQEILRFGRFPSFFLQYFAFLRGKGGLLGKVISGVDRAHRVLLGASVGLIGVSS